MGRPTHIFKGAWRTIKPTNLKFSEYNEESKKKSGFEETRLCKNSEKINILQEYSKENVKNYGITRHKVQLIFYYRPK